MIWGLSLCAPKGSESGTFRRRGLSSVPFPATGDFSFRRGISNTVVMTRLRSWGFQNSSKQLAPPHRKPSIQDDNEKGGSPNTSVRVPELQTSLLEGEVFPGPDHSQAVLSDLVSFASHPNRKLEETYQHRGKGTEDVNHHFPPIG